MTALSSALALHYPYDQSPPKKAVSGIIKREKQNNTQHTKVTTLIYAGGPALPCKKERGKKATHAHTHEKVARSGSILSPPLVINERATPYA